MALAHNIMVRNLNAIYLQAPQITTSKDITDFIIFAQTVCETIHHHHAGEEQWFFPDVEAYSGVAGIMDGNLAQHKAFESGFEQLNKYLETVTVETFNGVEVQRLVNSFGAVLAEHLKDEIQTLLQLDQYGGDKLLKAWDTLEKKAIDSIGDKVCFSFSFLA